MELFEKGMNAFSSLSRDSIDPLLLPEHPWHFWSFGWAAPLSQISAVLGISSKVLLVLKPCGWHCQALRALLHPLPNFSPVEMEYLSSLPWEIHSGAGNTLQLGRNFFPANFSLSIQPANPWMQPLLGPGILWH